MPSVACGFDKVAVFAGQVRQPRMSREGAGSKAQEIDLLAQPFGDGGGIVRYGGLFQVTRPWAIARYGKLHLQAGWWKFDCSYEGDAPVAEVRMSSAIDPLIVFPARDGSARIYVRGRDGYDLSLLVSPWPGEYGFSRLRLTRLGLRETFGLVTAAIGRLARRKGKLSILARAARRLMAGQAFGISLPSDRPSPPAAAAALPASTESHPARQVRDGGISILLKPGDHLHRDAMRIASEAFVLSPNVQVFFSDVSEAGIVIPHPEWDLLLAASGAFKGVPVFVRDSAGIVAGADLAQLAAGFGPLAIGRIPLPLVHRARARPFAPLLTPAPSLSRLPRVSVIIPTKYRIDLLEKCLSGLVRDTGYPGLEVVIVDNGVSDPRFAGVLAEAAKHLDLRKIEHKGPFNFSQLVNAGVRASSGEIVLLLNDDVQPTSEGWLHRIVASALQDEVGAVGACLTYPDGSIQHAGVVMGLGGACAHLWRGLAPKCASLNPYVVSPGARMAVTGACLAARRVAFDAVGGFDEQAYPVAFNDIDFCLRLHAAGYRNIYRGDARLIHHESQSRGPDDASSAARRRLAVESSRFLTRWGHVVHGDPHFSPAFDPRVEIGRVHPAGLAKPSDYDS